MLSRLSGAGERCKWRARPRTLKSTRLLGLQRFDRGRCARAALQDTRQRPLAPAEHKGRDALIILLLSCATGACGVSGTSRGESCERVAKAKSTRRRAWSSMLVRRGAKVTDRSQLQMVVGERTRGQKSRFSRRILPSWPFASMAEKHTTKHHTFCGLCATAKSATEMYG